MLFTFRNQVYQFKVKPVFGVLCLVFFILFCVAGVWQLHRYDFKKMLLQTYQQRLQEAPKSIMDVSETNAQFQSVDAQGEYLNEQTFFIENQVQDGKQNFEVITPFKMVGNEKLLLVDRGWIVSNTVPSVDVVKGKQKISGYLKSFNEYHFILGNNVLSTSPLVIQKLDVAEIEKIIKQHCYSYVLRLSTTEPYGFERGWKIVTVEPQRHMAYAVQWFAMAIVLAIAFFCFCCEKWVGERR